MKETPKYCDVSPAGNRYYLIRHGEATSNIKKKYSYKWQHEDPLTELGLGQVSKLAAEAAKHSIEVVFCSPFLRTRQTLEVINRLLEIPEEDIFFDERLEEINFGIADGKDYDEYHNHFADEQAYFESTVPNGENYQDIWNRLKAFLADVESKYHDRSILFISHGFPLRMLQLEAMGLDKKSAIGALKEEQYVLRGKLKKLQFPCK